MLERVVCDYRREDRWTDGYVCEVCSALSVVLCSEKGEELFLPLENQRND